MTFAPALVLITGASSGLGALAARRLAERGSEVVLVARRRDKLESLAAELERVHGVTAHVVVLDLSRLDAGPALLDALPAEVAGRPFDLVLNNAGFGLHGPFLDAEADRLQQMLTLNVTALTSIARSVLEPMVARGSGTLVNVASVGGFTPAPGMAAYVATKAYVLHLTEGLWHELRRSGVRVTALCPGPTSTDFFDVAGSSSGAMGGRVTTPEQVVDALLEALDQRRLPPSLVPDVPNRVLAHAARVLPRRLVLVVGSRLMKQP